MTAQTKAERKAAFRAGVAKAKAELAALTREALGKRVVDRRDLRYADLGARSVTDDVDVAIALDEMEIGDRLTLRGPSGVADVQIGVRNAMVTWWINGAIYLTQMEAVKAAFRATLPPDAFTAANTESQAAAQVHRDLSWLRASERWGTGRPLTRYAVPRRGKPARYAFSPLEGWLSTEVAELLERPLDLDEIEMVLKRLGRLDALNRFKFAKSATEIAATLNLPIRSVTDAIEAAGGFAVRWSESGKRWKYRIDRAYDVSCRPARGAYAVPGVRGAVEWDAARATAAARGFDANVVNVGGGSGFSLEIRRTSDGKLLTSTQYGSLTEETLRQAAAQVHRDLSWLRASERERGTGPIRYGVEIPFNRNGHVLRRDRAAQTTGRRSVRYVFSPAEFEEKFEELAGIVVRTVDLSRYGLTLEQIMDQNPGLAGDQVERLVRSVLKQRRLVKNGDRYFTASHFRESHPMNESGKRRKYDSAIRRDRYAEIFGRIRELWLQGKSIAQIETDLGIKILFGPDSTVGSLHRDVMGGFFEVA